MDRKSEVVLEVRVVFSGHVLNGSDRELIRSNVEEALERARQESLLTPSSWQGDDESVNETSCDYLIVNHALVGGAQ